MRIAFSVPSQASGRPRTGTPTINMGARTDSTSPQASPGGLRPEDVLTWSPRGDTPAKRWRWLRILHPQPAGIVGGLEVRGAAGVQLRRTAGRRRQGGEGYGHPRGGGKGPGENADADREQQTAVGRWGGTVSHPTAAMGRKVLSRSPSPSDLSGGRGSRGQPSLT